MYGLKKTIPIPRVNVEYRVNQYYLVRNVVTGEGTYLRCDEALSYGHNTILYGQLIPWEIRIYRGHFEYKGRPTVIPIPGMNRGKASLKALAMCIAATGGDTNQGAMPFGKVRLAQLPPWYDLQSAPYKQPHPEYPEEPVYAPDREVANMWKGTPYKEANCTMCRGWGYPCQGHTVNRDGLVRFARKALDLYDEVLRTGHIPVAFFWEYKEHLRRLMAGVNQGN